MLSSWKDSEGCINRRKQLELTCHLSYHNSSCTLGFDRDLTETNGSFIHWDVCFLGTKARSSCSKVCCCIDRYIRTYVCTGIHTSRIILALHTVVSVVVPIIYLRPLLLVGRLFSRILVISCSFVELQNGFVSSFSACSSILTNLSTVHQCDGMKASLRSYLNAVLDHKQMAISEGPRWPTDLAVAFGKGKRTCVCWWIQWKPH